LILTLVVFAVIVDVAAKDVTVKPLDVETTADDFRVPELSAAADAVDAVDVVDAVDAVEVSQAAVELLDDRNGFESLPP